MKRVLLIGASGLVGTQVLSQLERSSAVQVIHVLVRQPLSPEMKSSKVREFVLNFEKLEPASECFSVDSVFCAIGSTIKKAGSQEAFRKVDYEYPLRIAELCKSKGAQGFYLVSALGADAGSRIFYNRVKGELERDLQKLQLLKLVIARPSVLLGHRSESRPAEKISMQLGKLLPLKWRSIPAEKVARSLVQSFENSISGLHIVENQEIHGF